MCSTCGQKVLMDGLCCRHLKQQCLICLEPVGSTNTSTTKRLICNHAFHSGCIMEWFVTSDECPVCRAKQTEDPIVQFKEKVEDGMRAKYKDAIDSLEDEVKRLTETLRMQAMFVNGGNFGFFTLASNLSGTDFEHEHDPLPPPFGDLPGFNT